ncbi:glycoside hydrolase [Pisolithus albus]|nr:glycoside hydrolase [Pisolithus albus]
MTTDFLEASVHIMIISTSVPGPTAPLSATLPSQPPLFPVQSWCIGQIFRPGVVLQTVNIAQLYSDPKTFVDKSTSKSAQQVLADSATFNLSTATEGDLINFVENNFLGEGLELGAAELTNFKANPAFLSNVTDPLLNAFTQTVNGYWTRLARSTNQSALCDDYTNAALESSVDYWDSYWIMQGLLKSELYSTVNATLRNFMDEIDDFEFIPNGGRTYYLDRSEPPLFVKMRVSMLECLYPASIILGWMVYDYVAVMNDTSVLQRTLPLAEIELVWWANNCTTEITSPYTNQSYILARYSVNSSAPCPESYLTVSTESEDYLTASDPTYGTPLTQQQAEALYGELASGAGISRPASK